MQLQVGLHDDSLEWQHVFPQQQAAAAEIQEPWLATAVAVEGEWNLSGFQVKRRVENERHRQVGKGNRDRGGGVVGCLHSDTRQLS